ncbi:MAG: DNA-binding transcriptional LysR family regulator [Oceanospirillaceae bacterium]|jgi:DNA-binding transcriptional LysR family regulator
MANIVNMDIIALRSFVLSEKLGSFTSAAKIMHCSQTALSLRMKKLEEQLGSNLFHRNYHSLKLTASGKLLLPDAVSILEQHDRMVDMLRKATQKEVIRLGLEEDQAGFFFNKLMDNQTHFSHEIEVEFVMRLSRDLIKLTDENKLDIAIVSAMSDQLSGETLATTNLEWVCSPNFSYQPEQPLPLALHPDGCLYREHIIKLLKTLGIPYHIVFSAQGSMSIQAAVIAGMGITVIAANNIPPELKVAPTQWKLPILGKKEISLIQADNLSPIQMDFVDQLRFKFLSIKSD